MDPVGFQNARRMQEEGIAIQPVPGVGDDAFWVADPLQTLYVLQDTTYLDIGGDVQLEQVRPSLVLEDDVLIEVMMPLLQNDREHFPELARKAVSRL